MKFFDFDTATNHDISAAAKSVLDRCVFRDVTKKTRYMPMGGILAGVGPYQDLLTFQNRNFHLHSLLSGLKLTWHRASRQTSCTQCQSLLLSSDRGMRVRPSPSRRSSLFQPDRNHAGRQFHTPIRPNSRSDSPKKCENSNRWQETKERYTRVSSSLCSLSVSARWPLPLRARNN